MLRGRQDTWRLPPVGTERLGGFDILAEIGRGGMGVVYLARVVESGALVAIKALLPELRGDRRLADSFIDEGELARSLDHPNIVRVLAAATGDPMYIEMEYVHGESLASILTETGRLPYHLAAWVGAEIASALAAAHERGVVHRDVAPHNILVGYDGRPRLTDFGIARTEHRRTVTEIGEVKGRRDYMPPEQLRGEPVGPPADLYALGVTVFRAAAGALPTWRDAIVQVPDGLADEFPAGLLAAVGALTAARPADRPASAAEACERLRRCAADLGGGSADELAAFIAEPFGSGRVLKEKIISGGDLASSATEILGARAAPPITERRRSRRWIWPAAIGAVVAAATVIAATRLVGNRVPGRRLPSAICMQAAAATRPEDRLRDYVMVRLLAEALARPGTIAVTHGYRDPAGCSRLGVPVATTSADGDVIELAWAGGRARVSARGPDQAVRGLLAELGVEPPEPLSLSWESAFHVLNVKEMFSYDRTSPTAEGLFEKGRRQAPSEEIVYLMEAAHRWSMGQMPANAVPRTIPDGISSRTASHLQAVVALADGDPERARALVGEWPNLTPTTWDGRWTEAMFRLVAGELMFHGGDPQRGIALLEDALALDPSLEAPTYHLLRHHLARADYAAVATVSSIIARHQPSAAVPADFRLRALLAKGDYAAARRGYEQMLGGSRDAPENLEGAQIGLLYALAMTEPLADALRHAETVAADRIKEPGVAAVMPEPVVYALALARGDAALRDAWARRLRDKLVPPWTANRELLVHTVTILDHLAGRAPRWPAPVGVADRTYRFRRQRDLARALAARAAGDLAALDAIGEAAIDPEVRALVAGVAARVRGDPARAIADFETALEQSADGELDCVAAGWLAEAQRAVGDERAASESCRRVLQPRIPTPYCFVIPACARAR